MVLKRAGAGRESHLRWRRRLHTFSERKLLLLDEISQEYAFPTKNPRLNVGEDSCGNSRGEKAKCGGRQVVQAILESEPTTAFRFRHHSGGVGPREYVQDGVARIGQETNEELW